MRVLNLYCGIGGNRKLWEGVEVTAIENDKGQSIEKKMSDRGLNIKNWHGYELDKRQLINNCVEPEMGNHILNYAKSNCMVLL